MRLTWSTDIDQVRKWLRDWEWCVITQRGVFSNGNRILLYKQLIHPVMDYVCPNWRSATCTHVRKLQVLQSKYLCIGTLVTGKFTRIFEFHSLPTTSDL
jgi:hypothetical protein